MRVVVYSDEDLEPITVLRLPITERDIESRGRVWRVPVPEQFTISVQPLSKEEMMRPVRVVELWFERFVRDRHGHKQETWMCFTKADDLAMLLNPDWLPGQRSAVNYLQDQNDSLVRMLMRVMSV